MRVRIEMAKTASAIWKWMVIYYLLNDYDACRARAMLMTLTKCHIDTLHSQCILAHTNTRERMRASVAYIERTQQLNKNIFVYFLFLCGINSNFFASWHSHNQCNASVCKNILFILILNWIYFCYYGGPRRHRFHRGRCVPGITFIYFICSLLICITEFILFFNSSVYRWQFPRIDERER